MFQLAISSASLNFISERRGIVLCGFAVLDSFSWGILVILISKDDIALLSKPVGCGVSSSWTVF